MAQHIPAPRHNLGGAMGHIEARRHMVERLNSFTVLPNRVSGFYEIFFQGTATEQEIAVDVVFPVWFVDKPSMSFGAELLRDLLTDGEFPTISVVVVAWTKTKEDHVGGGYFTGARLAIVASGREGEQMIVHWQADGKALAVVPQV